MYVQFAGEAPCVSDSDTHSAVEFAKTVAPEEISAMIRTLARRPSGREAIRNSPTFVRAIALGKREAKRSVQLKRGKELAKMAAKASHAKGCVTKISKKVDKAEARNKGLRTLVTKVYATHCHTYTTTHQRRHTLLHTVQRRSKSTECAGQRIQIRSENLRTKGKESQQRGQ